MRAGLGAAASLPCRWEGVGGPSEGARRLLAKRISWLSPRLPRRLLLSIQAAVLGCRGARQGAARVRLAALSKLTSRGLGAANRSGRRALGSLTRSRQRAGLAGGPRGAANVPSATALRCACSLPGCPPAEKPLPARSVLGCVPSPPPASFTPWRSGRRDGSIGAAHQAYRHPLPPPPAPPSVIARRPRLKPVKVGSGGWPLHQQEVQVNGIARS